MNTRDSINKQNVIHIFLMNVIINGDISFSGKNLNINRNKLRKFKNQQKATTEKLLCQTKHVRHKGKYIIRSVWDPWEVDLISGDQQIIGCLGLIEVGKRTREYLGWWIHSISVTCIGNPQATQVWITQVLLQLDFFDKYILWYDPRFLNLQMWNCGYRGLIVKCSHIFWPHGGS